MTWCKDVIYCTVLFDKIKCFDFITNCHKSESDEQSQCFYVLIFSRRQLSTLVESVHLDAVIIHGGSGKKVRGNLSGECDEQKLRKRTVLVHSSFQPQLFLKMKNHSWKNDLIHYSLSNKDTSSLELYRHYQAVLSNRLLYKFKLSII